MHKLFRYPRIFTWFVIFLLTVIQALLGYFIFKQSFFNMTFGMVIFPNLVTAVIIFITWLFAKIKSGKVKK